MKKKTYKEKFLNTSRYYDSAHTCPLSVYIDLLCDNHLSGLIISGNPSEEELEIAKSVIMQEFSLISDSESANRLFRTAQKIYSLTSRISGFHIAVNAIQFGQYEEAFKFLRHFGLTFEVPQEEKDKKDILKKVTQKMKSLFIPLNEAKKEYEEMTRNRKGSEITKADFEKQISVISKYMGFRIDKHTITLAEYGACLYHFKKELEHENRQSIHK